MSWNQNEETAQCCIDEDDGCEDHPGSLGEQLLDKRLADAEERHECVLRTASEGKKGIEHVLMRGEQVHADGEGEDELCDISFDNKYKNWKELTQHRVTLE
jgi:hypothetical protein